MSKGTCYLVLSGGTLSFCKTFFRNRKCLLWTVLSKFVHNISEKFLNYLQISGNLLNFIIYIINFRQVDNKRFNFFIKYTAHYTKFFLFFNPNFQWIYFLNGLSPQLLMAYLYRNSKDASAISMRFNMQRYGENRRTEEPAFSAIESMTYCF